MLNYLTCIFQGIVNVFKYEPTVRPSCKNVRTSKVTVQRPENCRDLSAQAPGRLECIVLPKQKGSLACNSFLRPKIKHFSDKKHSFYKTKLPRIQATN